MTDATRDPAPQGLLFLKEALGLVGGASLLISGGAAIFSTVYLAALPPLPRLLSWPDRVDVALISASWQIGLVLLVLLTLAWLSLVEKPVPEAPMEARASRFAIFAFRRAPSLLVVALANVAALGFVLFGLNSFEAAGASPSVWIAPAGAAIALVSLFKISKIFQPDAFRAYDRLLLAGTIATFTWIAAGAWSKANHDLLREGAHSVQFGETSTGNQLPSHCVTLVLANSRMLAYIDHHQAVFQERRKDGAPLRVSRCGASRAS